MQAHVFEEILTFPQECEVIDNTSVIIGRGVILLLITACHTNDTPLDIKHVL